ncbi:amino acid adenylation domain-containing protein [Acetivibrio straminisolvens]|uniref:Malonyl CoA-acyl carrier protein transacylase n=1 Tax=Acetivibrio straminisolvens JCM 21531 TaxID=1294263 RepID=W4V208_9FIRM|nr:amino acid adenylation domain-containing protein [Acetivibrio straminisolvens]GAE87152.1 malonyl CoA-acyl carrier protein transacylase [Acetivibrio straminisolvens JCM 21531]
MLKSSKDDIKGSIYELISKVTGYDAAELDNDMYLEVDLGIDSIKMITLMNELMNLVPQDQMEEFSAKYPVSSILSMQTVGDIVEIFENWHSEKSPQHAHVEDTQNVIEPEIVVEKQPEYLEIVNSQYPFLTCYQAISTLTISSAIEIQGELNISCLRSAWEELILRHPALRVVFEKVPGAKNFKGYKQRLVEGFNLPDIKVEDISHVGSGEKERFVREKIEESLNQKFDIFQWPLHKITVIRTGSERYCIVLSIIHLITDGLGNQQILRELLEIYSAKLAGKKADLPKAISVSEYSSLVKEMNSWDNPQENSEFESYIREQGKDSYFYNPYGNDKKLVIPEPFVPIKTKVKKFWIPEDVTGKLVSNTKVWRSSLFVLIVSAYLKSIKQLNESENKIILNLPTGGKVYPNADATDVLGCFAQNMALSFFVENPNEAWDDLIEKVNTEIKSKLSSGIDRAQTLKAANAAKENEMLTDGQMSPAIAKVIRASVKSNLYLSFVGDTNIKKEYNDLKIKDYEAYTCTNPGTIDILVELFHNKLLLTSNYDSSFFDEDYIDRHMNNLINNIKELAEISTTQKNVMKTECLATAALDVQKDILEKASEICRRKLTEADIDKDIDSEIGMDSLGRIRLVAKLSKDRENIDRKGLFACRTLREMALLLDSRGGAANENIDKIEIQIPFLKIAEQCKLTPDAPAIYFQGKSVTYSELERATNKLANCLIDQGIKRGSLVGIMTLPGPMMLIGMIGILKAGAAYVPVDSSYPAERIQYIINHSDINILLTEDSLIGQINDLINNCPGIKKLILLDSKTYSKEVKVSELIEKEKWMEYSEIPPVYSSSPEDLMVVLYTSGSTGRPKGVMLNHLGYMNRLVWHQKIFDLKPGERVAQKTSCCFDISIWELFWPLMYGGTVCPVRKDIVKNPWALAEWLIETKINIMHFVPSLFGEFVHALEDENYTFKDLRWLIFSGEALPMSYINKWIDKHGMTVKLANLYGPTEASIDVTYHIIDKRPGSDGESQIPIGKPVDNVYILNLDENMNRKKDGEIGELWIGGIQLAKGYLKDPERTSEAFRPNPFKEIPGEFLYRTGDLTRVREDGSFEYHGRIDNQVKIRGFRIELGEIEAVLSSHSNVNEAAVVVIDEGEGQSQLVACLSGKITEESELKEFIGKKLPYYMIPHRIEWLESLPKNPNGKLDRRLLRICLTEYRKRKKKLFFPLHRLNAG